MITIPIHSIDDGTFARYTQQNNVFEMKQHRVEGIENDDIIRRRHNMHSGR